MPWLGCQPRSLWDKVHANEFFMSKVDFSYFWNPSS